MNKKLIRVSNALLLTEFKHIFRVMKLTSLFGVLCVSSAFAVNINSQSLRVNIYANQKQAKEVIKQIEEQTDYLFVYNHDKVNLDNTVTIQANNETVAEVLNQMFAGTDIVYAMQGNNILLMHRNDKDLQQDRILRGTIIDTDGTPIIGANVVIKGSSNGTISDFDGHFSLEVKEGDVLVVSYIGYTDYEVRVGNQNNLSITLKEDSKALDEVVVVGYGTQTKVNLTGAVSTISKDDLVNRPVTNVSSALQGLTPGVTITSGTGQPGNDASTIRVRGVGTLNNANPYILVDGIETGTFDSIDPNDIESISVLKDAASAAIYGSKAANGVILVTTKRGKKGKATVSYNGNVSFSNVTTLIDRLSSYDCARLYNQLLTQSGGSPRFTDEDLQLFKDGSDPYGHPNTVWTDYIYQTGFMHKHNLNVSGGSEDVKYMASGGFLGQEGTLKNSDRQQFNLRTNLDIKLSDKFTMRTNMAFIHNNYSEPNASYGGGSSQFIWQANRIAPWVPYKKEDGSYGSISDGNPAAWIDINSRKYHLQQNFSGIMAFDYQPIEGLTFTLQ